ncbi:MAG: flagellar biosynthesis protein FlhF [Gammaproteobacteria bacterium]|nr:flagellar biosynthesis protein FlhF [Gammaproteobacteria bacterium]
MKLKRFYAPDIRQAINKVRDELGSDAVILSNRQTDGGVEIIAAIDYDDAMLQQKTPHSERSAVAEKSAPVTGARAYAEEQSAFAQMMDKQVGGKEPFWKHVKDKLAATDDGNDSPASAPKANKAKVKAKPKAKNTDDDQQTMEWLAKFDDPDMDENDELDDDTEVRRPAPAKAATPRQEKSPVATQKQTEDQSMREVWSELSNLRGLLEQQLSSLAWGEMGRKHPYRAKAMRHLLQMGVSPGICRRLVESANTDQSFELVWRQVLANFVSRLPVIQDDVLMRGGVFALVGPTGVGKTTTLVKMAARYALQHGTDKIALITTDNYRVGALEQLRTYGRIMEAPVRVANDSAELKDILKSMYDRKLVLIDTAGMSQRDMRLTEQFSMLRDGTSQIKTYLVMSASTQYSVMEETAKAYGKVVLDGCIFTKLDETNSLGSALSVAAEQQLPIAYVCDGQRVPEDLHMEKAVTLVKRAIGMMQKSNHVIDDEMVEMAFGEAAANHVS